MICPHAPTTRTPIDGTDPYAYCHTCDWWWKYNPIVGRWYRHFPEGSDHA